MAACPQRGAVHVFKVTDEDWTARIDCGAEGNGDPIHTPIYPQISMFFRSCEGGVGSRWKKYSLLLRVGSELVAEFMLELPVNHDTSYG